MTFTWWKQDNKTEDIESEETQDIIGPEPEEDADPDDDPDIDMEAENDENMRIDEELVMCKLVNLIKEKNRIQMLHRLHSFGLITLAVSRTTTGWRPRQGRMGCMVLCRTFHTAPEQRRGPTPIVPHCSGSGSSSCPGTGHRQCDYTIWMEGVGLLCVYAPLDAYETFLLSGRRKG